MASPAAHLQILVTASTAAANASLVKTDAQLKRTTATANTASTAMGPKLASAAKMGAAAVGVGLVYAMGKAVKVGADFEKQMDAVGSVANASAKEMKQLEKQALSLGQKTAFSALEVAQAQEELVKGGLKLKDVLDGGLKASLSLAAAGQLELADASATTVNAMKLFGLEGQDAMKVADMLATAANKTTADVSDFAVALQQGGSAAKAAGYDLNQTITVLEALAQVGIRNSDAGTSLKTAFLQLLAPTEKQAKLANKLNIEWINQNGELKNAAGLSIELRDALGGMTKAQQAANLKLLAGTDGFRTLNALLDQGPEKLRDLTKANEENGTANEIAREKMDNLAGSMEQLGGAVQTLMIQFSKLVSPTIRDGVDWLTQALTDISKANFDELMADKDVQSFVDGMGEITNAVKVMWEKVTWPTLKAMWPAFKQVFGNLAKVIGGFVQIIAGILTLDLGRVLDGMVTTFKGAFEMLVGVVRYATAPIRTVFARLGHIAAKVFSTPVRAIVSTVKFVMDKTLGVISSALRVAASIADKLSGIPIIGDKFKGLGDAATSAADDIDGFRDTLRGDDAAIKKEAEALKGLAEVFRDLGDDVADVAGKISDKAKAITKDFGKVTDKSGKMAKGVAGNSDAMVNAVTSGLQAFGDNVNEALKAFQVKKVSFSLKKVSNTVGNVLGAQKGAIVPGSGSGDKVPLHVGGQLAAMVEPGEQVSVLNRKATQRLMDYNAAVPRFASGGVIEQALGPYSIGPIAYDPNHAGGNSHLHLDFFTKSQAIAYGKKMQGMGWSIGEYSGPYGGFGGLTASHQSPGHYDGTAFDANTPQDETRAQVAAVARLLGSGDVSGGVAEKIARMILKGPKGPLRSMGQAGLDMARNAANKFIAASMPRDTSGGALASADGNVERVFAQIAKKLSTSRTATLALGEAGYAESGMRDLSYGDASSQGALQLLASTAAGMGISPHDEGAIASAFLLRGFYGKGGANSLAASGLPAHLVAQNVQGSAFSSGSNYAAQKGPALSWMSRFGLQRGGLVPHLAKGNTLKFRDPLGEAQRTARQLRKLTGGAGSIARLDERLGIAQTLADADGVLTENEIARQVRLQQSLLHDLRTANKLSSTGSRYARLAGSKGRNLRELFGSTRTEMSGVTGKGGRIFDTLQAIAELKGTAAAGSAAMDISGLRSVIQASRYGVFDGMFAKGGRIASGHWGIAGERGPEIVHGPATVTPVGGETFVGYALLDLGDGISKKVRLEFDKRDQSSHRRQRQYG